MRSFVGSAIVFFDGKGRSFFVDGVECDRFYGDDYSREGRSRFCVVGKSDHLV